MSICHATGQPTKYVLIKSISKAGVVNGHYGVEHHGARPAGHHDARRGMAPRQHRRLHEAVAAGIELVAAARQVDRALEAAAEHHDPIDAFGRRGTREPVLERSEHDGAERRPGGQREDQEGRADAEAVFA